MIPEERPQADQMLVTMTKGELAELISSAVRQGYSSAVESAREERAIENKRKEILVGGKEIAEFLGMSGRTFYNHFHAGRFDGAIQKLGNKLYARREELTAKLSETAETLHHEEYEAI